MYKGFTSPLGKGTNFNLRGMLVIHSNVDDAVPMFFTPKQAVQVLYGLRRDWSQTVKEIQEIEASLEQEKKESASSVSLYQMWSTPKLRRSAKRHTGRNTLSNRDSAREH